MNPSVLLVNPDEFSMGWRGATPRIMDLAEGLTRHGWSVSMLTRRSSTSIDHSSLETAFSGRIIRTPFSGSYIPWMDTHDVLRRANRGLWKLKGKANYIRALQFGWAVRTAQWAQSHWAGPLPNVVWSISSSNLTGTFAGRYLSRVFARPLVVELHDPPIYPGSNNPCPEIPRGFARCVRHSSRIVTTTESYAKYLRKEYSRSPSQVVPIYLSYRGTLATPKPRDKNNDDLVLLHAGSLTSSRGQNARTLLEALALAFKENPACQGHLRLRLLGGGEGTTAFVSLAQSLDLAGVLECAPEVPYDQVKKEMEAADVLLVVKYTEEKYAMQIPGKLFEYLGMGKPILGIMRQSTEAAEILDRSGLGIVPEHGNVEALSKSILNLWSNRHRLHEAYKADQVYVRQFSSEAMANHANALLNEVLASPTDT